MPDPRDNRGKRHDFHFVLFGVLLATMAGKVLVAEIYRFLVRHHQCLCTLLAVEQTRSISDVQLRRLLALVDVAAYQHFHVRYFGWQPRLLPFGSWISFDGKELRGTIDGVGGQKRGLSIVRPLLDERHISLSAQFYHGAKDSEMICLRTLLLAQCHSIVKGHGRLEERKAFFYPVQAVCFEPRWDKAGFATLVVVEREATQCKTGKVSRETSYYMTNASIGQVPPEELFKAIRKHWSIEADHWVRDCTFREDRIRCQEPTRSKTLASVISVAGNLLWQQKKGSLKAMQEDIACNPVKAPPFFKHNDIL